MTTITLEELKKYINDTYEIEDGKDSSTKATIYAIHTISYAIVAARAQLSEDDVNTVIASLNNKENNTFIKSLLNMNCREAIYEAEKAIDEAEKAVDEAEKAEKAVDEAENTKTSTLYLKDASSIAEILNQLILKYDRFTKQ